MATAQDKFKELLTGDFSPWLKERGFKRRDTTFRRRDDQAWQILNFQRSRFSDACNVRFTINLGVALDVLHGEPSWGSRGHFGVRVRFPRANRAATQGRGLLVEAPPAPPDAGIVKDVLAALETALP